MTPLAFELLKDLTTPGAFRSRVDRKIFYSAVMTSKFFDMSAVSELMFDTAKKLGEQFEERGWFSGRLAFLPAANTWLEYEIEYEEVLSDEDNRVVTGKKRIATVLVSDGDCTHEANLVSFCRDHYGQWTVNRPLGQTALPLVHSQKPPDREAQQRWREYIVKKAPELAAEAAEAPLLATHFTMYSALALINSPRIIGQKQHRPHERLEREKLKTLGLVGKFPLRAWTEIILKVALPDDRSGEPSTEAHLTGDKCLHFCRTHLRVRLGQVEYVEGHYRGNPALGFKRSRYLVER